MKEREMWACISAAPGMYFSKIQRLMNTFGNIENVMNATKNTLMERGALGKEDAEKFIGHISRFDSHKFFEKLGEKAIQFVAVSDENYPGILMPYSHKPYFLFYKGKLPDDNLPSVAMVGARACSNYGRTMAKEIGKALSEKGVQIISGMARGIDTYSQLGALEGNTATFAVLGCGADICYPTENIELYHDIIKNGGIISEYLPGSPPEAWHFPQRNRIISGLADKIVVVEAKERSGSLITVEWALEQGKDVMAVPGRIGERLSGGCNNLIRSGAGIVTCVEDIFSELKYIVFKEEQKGRMEQKTLEKDFLLLYSELGLQPKSVYELMEHTGIIYEKIVSMLLKLQLEGLIEQPYENYFSKKYT